MRGRLFLRFMVCAAAALVLAPGSVSASSFTLDTCITGTSCTGLAGSIDVNIVTDPGDTVPVVSAGDPGEVAFTIANNLAGSAASGSKFTNLELLYGTKNVFGTQTINLTITDADVTAGVITIPTAAYNPGVDASFAINIDFGFATAQGDGLFGPGEALSFDLLFPGHPLDPALFTFAIAHVQAVCASAADNCGQVGRSIKLIDDNVPTPEPDTSVPEPGTLLLLGSGLVLAATQLRRRRA